MRTFWPLALASLVPASLVACSSKSHDVTMNWSDTKQTMDGFGASSAFFGQSLTNDQADQLFDPKKGIGLSLLRTMIGVPADTMTDGTEPTTGAVPTPTAPELTTAQQAAVRGCQVWAAAWTPPRSGRRPTVRTAPRRRTGESTSPPTSWIRLITRTSQPT